MIKAILDGKFPEFVNDFLAFQFPDGVVPSWVKDALAAAGVPLNL